jgi:hypothetical protein
LRASLVESSLLAKARSEKLADDEMVSEDQESSIDLDLDIFASLNEASEESLLDIKPEEVKQVIQVSKSLSFHIFRQL